MNSTVTAPRRASRARNGLSLAGVVVALAFATGVSGQTITVTTAQGATASLGQSFDVPITIDMSAHGGLLGSFSLELRWDPSTLAWVTGVPGSFGDATANEDSVSVGAVFVAGANPTGAGGLVTIGTARFMPTVLDTTTLSITVHELYEAGTFTDLLPLVNVVNRQFCPGQGRYGDINGDGQFNSADALIALNNSVGLPTTGDITLGDVDADGDTDPRDALVMLSSGAGIDVSQFRIGLLAPGVACAGGGGVTYGLTPAAATILPGQNLLLTMLGVDSAGVPVAATNVSFTSNDSAVAVVDSSGVLLAVGPGTATINAMQDSTVAASTTITVVADRTIHWVDGLAFNTLNQVGTAALPFADVAGAMAVATAGDTVMLRPGKYPEGILVSQPIVLMGDTASGPRPIITAGTTFGTGLDINTNGNVELHSLTVDTLQTGVSVTLADTVLIRDLAFVGNARGFTSLFLDSAQAVHVTNTTFFGDVLNSVFTGTSGIHAMARSATLTLDSVTISNYGQFGVEIVELDSLDIRRSTIRNNWSYGVYEFNSDTVNTLAFVLEDSRISGHNSGSFLLRTVRSAYLSHNVLDGGGGSGNRIDGYRPTSIFIRGDSVVQPLNGNFTIAYNLFTADTVYIDSVTAVGGTGQIQALDVRSMVVRDSDFESNTFNYAIFADSRGATLADHRLVVRNVTVSGPDSTVCAQCGYGIGAFRVKLDVDTLTADRMGIGMFVWDSAATVRNVTIDDFSTALRSSCALVDYRHVNLSNGTWGFISSGGCKPADTLLIDSTTVTNVVYGVDSDDVPLKMTNSSIVNATAWGVQHVDSAVVLTDNFVSLSGNSYGLYLDINSSDSSVITGNTVDCSTSTGNPTGIYFLDGPARIQNDTVIGCFAGIRSLVSLGAGSLVNIRDNVITMRSGHDYGIWAQGAAGRHHIVSNTVTGQGPLGADYGVFLEGLGAPYGRIDSNLVDGSSRAGVWVGRGDSLFIRDNQTLNIRAGGGNASGAAGAAGVVVGTADANAAVVEVRRNRVSNSARSGIIVSRNTTLDSVIVLLDSNTVKNANEYGIWIDNRSNAQIQYNAIDSAGLDAIYLDRFDTTTTFHDTVWVNFNNLTNSGRYGMQNVRAVDQILADNNWWNDVLGPAGAFGDPGSSGDSVSQFIIWVPPLTAPVNTLVPTAPPALAPVVSFAPRDRGARLDTRSPPVSGPVATPEFDVTAALPPPVGGPDPSPIPVPFVRPVPPGRPAWFEALLDRDRRWAEWIRVERERTEARRLQLVSPPRTGGVR